MFIYFENVKEDELTIDRNGSSDEKTYCQSKHAGHEDSNKKDEKLSSTSL
jgi:hypothetical protein